MLFNPISDRRIPRTHQIMEYNNDVKHQYQGPLR